MNFISWKPFFFFFFFFFFVLSTQRELTEASKKIWKQANHPPRGWNSYDSFSWIINEEEFLQNAELVSKRLLTHGYQYVVVDFLWYRKNVKGATKDSGGLDVIDKWGRVIPEPERFPSSRYGEGFTELAKKVHAMGLLFGIHIMRGISTQAVNANTPILDTSTGAAYNESGRLWTAKDIGLTDRKCAWMPQGFMSVNTKLGAGRAFLRSLHQQYAEWGVDFGFQGRIQVKGRDDIKIFMQVLKEIDRPIVYSLSPGVGATPAMAKDVSPLVNMYRVTGDDWDSWSDVASHFNISSNFAAANMIGSTGLRGNSWPDLDMLPLGWLTDPGVNQGPHRNSNLTIEEQRTQITLWSIAKTPLMFGGDMRKLDDATYNIIANPTLLEINTFSRHNMEFPYITGENGTVTTSTSSKEMNASDSHFLGLTFCKDPRVKGWVSVVLDNELEKICWKDKIGRKQSPPFCLYKSKHLLKSGDEKIPQEQKYHGKHHLSALDSTELCLDASSKGKLRSHELKTSSFSPCRWDTNQLWELNNNDTLVNSYSGLCGVLKPVEGKGQIYLAFFNLSPRKMVISTKITDLHKVLRRSNISQGSCKYREVWTGKDYGIAEETISLEVVHGNIEIIGLGQLAMGFGGLVRLGLMPVGHVNFAGKQIECEVEDGGWVAGKHGESVFSSLKPKIRNGAVYLIYGFVSLYGGDFGFVEDGFVYWIGDDGWDLIGGGK
ncbi:hypothetical protein IFM89_033830 [Coptis chinensis]|uniref:Alpha-galactosidase n=1 Tax=Coptis chinensis TaxID=261450 RepID=A0A835HP52_9MAGN|nr:hypothetical protein IFM89_033830 [Coptis chinensis]